MRKKLFFITIPLQGKNQLGKTRYRKEDKGELYSRETSFPGIAMLENCVQGNEDIRIVTVRTAVENGETEKNYEQFKSELSELADEMGRELTISGEILIPHSENRHKQVEFFKELCAQCEPDCDVYMDITFGTKVTSVCMFTLLTYAEKMLCDDICGIYYGKYDHYNNTPGELYNVRSMYDIAALIRSAEHLPQDNINDLLELLWRGE